MKLEYTLINGKDGLDESQYLFVGPNISELGTTIEADLDDEVSLYYGYGKLNIPDNIIEIGDFAFRGCSGFSGSLTIPNSVTEIGWGAFDGCSGLTSITCLATTPPTLGSNAFQNTNNCTIYVPAGSVDAYKSAFSWTNYVSRIQPITT